MAPSWATMNNRKRTEKRTIPPHNLDRDLLSLAIKTLISILFSPHCHQHCHQLPVSRLPLAAGTRGMSPSPRLDSHRSDLPIEDQQLLVWATWASKAPPVPCFSHVGSPTVQVPISFLQSKLVELLVFAGWHNQQGPHLNCTRLMERCPSIHTPDILGGWGGSEGGSAPSRDASCIPKYISEVTRMICCLHHWEDGTWLWWSPGERWLPACCCW